MSGAFPRFQSEAAETQIPRCCCQPVRVFQNLKIQRSVGRATDGTTFPLSLKLKCGPSSEEVEGGQGAPEPGYTASVWAFSTISGLITLLPDGTIYGINHSFALTLSGYGKSELLGKVGPPWVAGRVPCGQRTCVLGTVHAGFPGRMWA